MTSADWLLRALNLAAALAAAYFATGGKTSFAAPAAAFAAASAVEAAVAFSGRPSDARLRRWSVLAFSCLDSALVLCLALWARPAAWSVDLAFLLPAVLAALEHGPLAGALAGAIPAAAAALLLRDLPAYGAAGPSALPMRLMFFVLAPAAAGLMLPAARAEASGRARVTLARLRAAQVGEYVSYALFQLRDYMITIASVTEALALSVPADNGKLAERVGRLRRSVGELNGKISRLLGHNSALTSTAALTQAPVDLPALAADAAAEARAAFAPASVAIDVAIRGDVAPARTDRRSIELALLAALQNSCEACAARGGGRVTLSLRQDGAAAEFEVADDGGGVSELFTHLVFEPLACARAGTNGMGLGLSMSRRFLERLGGTVRLKTVDGVTTVLLIVPLDREFPRIRDEESTWAARRAGTAQGEAGS